MSISIITARLTNARRAYDKLKQVLLKNQGESDVYLELVDGSESTTMILGDHLRVERSGNLMGDLKATMGAGILG